MSEQQVISKPPTALASFAKCATPGTAECAKFDDIEASIANCEQVEFPCVHRFTPGMYIRETTLPKNTLLTTHVHLTEHPYVVSKGVVSVWTEEKGVVKIEAPYTGITKPGARRIIYAHEDTIWTTFHVTNETDVDKIKQEILLEHHEHLPFVDTEKPEERNILIE